MIVGNSVRAIPVNLMRKKNICIYIFIRFLKFQFEILLIWEFITSQNLNSNFDTLWTRKNQNSNKRLWDFEILETFRKKLKFEILWNFKTRNSNSKFLEFKNSRFYKILKIFETLKNSNSRFCEIMNSRIWEVVNI